MIRHGLARRLFSGLAAVVVCGALAASGCGNDTTTPTTTSTTRSSPATETFTTNIPPSGSAWRFVSAIQTGTVNATITSTDQPSTVVGFGIGMRGNTTGCLVTRDLTAAAGSSPQVTATVDAGDYCIKVFDVGNIRTPLSFTVTITYP